MNPLHAAGCGAMRGVLVHQEDGQKLVISRVRDSVALLLNWQLLFGTSTGNTENSTR
jgi:hypothetical protein